MKFRLLLTLLLVILAAQVASAGMITGYVLDPNWYAPHPTLTAPQVYGTGMYEYGAAGNLVGASTLGLYTQTGIYGEYTKTLTSGTYTFASWDTWWRSQFIFNQYLNLSLRTIIRLHANMWSYGPTWGSGAYNEIGQTFAASGSSIAMVVVRSPLAGVNFTCSIHEGGPGGPQVGPSRSFTSTAGPSDIRMVWCGGEVPTVPGQIYYLRFKAAGETKGMFCLNSPTPDLSDPMPEGCLCFDGVPDPSADLGVTICSDDDGLTTSMYTQKSSTTTWATNVGQTFTARGVSLIGFAAWLPDTNPTYVATLYNSVGGTQIGTAKQAKVMRWGDPEVLWTWGPDECPLTPGQTYYMEVTKDGGGIFQAYLNPYWLYGGGGAYVNRTAQAPGMDMAATITEQESAGSATKPTVQFGAYPAVALADRNTTSLTVRWTTDVAADSTVEYSAWNCPYTDAYYNSALVTSHVATITGLKPNTMYHFRVKGAKSNYRTGVSRDLVVCTTNDTANLLANPSFEDGSGTSPRKPVPSWTCTGMDFGASDGTWFGELPPYVGSWLLQAAVNGSNCNGVAYQTVSATPGFEYRLTAALMSWMMESPGGNLRTKYDVWYDKNRLDHCRIGIDPFGGTDPNAATVVWSPLMYSHTRYTNLGVRTVAGSNQVTVFFNLVGVGGSWHLYGVDDCRLTAHMPAVYALSDLKANQPDGISAQVNDVIVTAVPAEVGSYYVETADRSTGIRVVSNDLVTQGQKVVVRGTLGTDPNTHERMIIDAVLTDAVADTEPEALLMQCKSIGGGALGSIPALPGSTGPHNTGLVVRLAGKVTAKDLAEGKWIFINDGSMPGDGVKVDTSHIMLSVVPDIGAVASVSGISSAYYDGQVKPLVIVRREDDIPDPYGP